MEFHKWSHITYETMFKTVAQCYIAFLDRKNYIEENFSTMPAKKSTKKKSRKMDSKLVAAKQKHEVRYEAKKKHVSQKAVRDAVKKVGHSRKAIDKELSK